MEAFHRLHQCAQHALCDFWQLLWVQGAAAWEACIKPSFAADISLGLEEATVKYQVLYNKKQQPAPANCLSANVPEANFSHVRVTGIATTAKALCLALLTSNPPGLQLAALVYVNYSSLRHH